MSKIDMLPRVGMRIIKTAFAVLICYLIYMLPILNQVPQAPYNALIASIMCLQTDVQSTTKAALERILGTIVGGIFGVGALCIERQIFGVATGYLWSGVFYSILIVPLIYVTVLFRRSGAAGITCVVFLTIAVTHSGDVSPFVYGITRMGDTFIGIFVSLLVNVVHIPHRKKNPKQLFVLDLGSTFGYDEDEIPLFVKIHLNQLVNDGAKIAIMTSRTVAEALPFLKGIHLKLPMIALNGAVIYDFNEHRYINIETIDEPVAEKIEKVLDEMQLNAFCFTVVNDLMQVHYSFFNSPAEEAYYRGAITTPFRSFVCAKRNVNHPAIRYMIIDTFDRVHQLREALNDAGLHNDVSIRIFESKTQKGYYHLEIQSARVDKMRLLQKLKERTGSEEISVFVGHAYDFPIVEFANHAFAMRDGDDLLKAGHFVVIDHHPKKILKAIEKLLYSKR